jgi:hypothetical protein
LLEIRDCTVHRDTYRKCKIHATVLAKLAQKILTNPDPSRPSAKRTWLEMQELEGARYAITCHLVGDVAVITYARVSK